jgi:hypothetical protein
MRTDGAHEEALSKQLQGDNPEIAPLSPAMSARALTYEEYDPID